MADNFTTDPASLAPPAAKRRSKTAAQRREQAKRSAARLAAAAILIVEPATPSGTRLHPAGITSPLSTPSSAAALAAITAAPSPTSPPALAPPAARDISCLLTSPGRSPWRSLRARKRRAHRPHRHERLARAVVISQHRGIHLHHSQMVHNAFEQLRDACYDALGPLYAQLEPQDRCSPGSATPPTSAHPALSYVPAPGRLLVHARDDREACWEEIIHLAAIGGEAQEPDNPWAAQEAVDAFYRLEDFWRDEFIAAHTALIEDADTFDAQMLTPFKLRTDAGKSRIMEYNDECFILQLNKEQWDAVLNELYRATIAQLPPFGYDDEQGHRPGRYQLESLEDLAQTCRTIRAVCLRRVYAYVNLTRRHSIFALAAGQGNGAFFYREEPSTLAARAPRGMDLIPSVPFLHTTALEMKVSSAWLVEEHLRAAGLCLRSLRHLYLHICVGQRSGGEQAASECRRALLQINVFLTSCAGLDLVSLGIWFTDGTLSLDRLHAVSVEDAMEWQPLAIGPKLSKLLFFPRLFETGLFETETRPAAAGNLRFLPWPCGLEELVMDANDFCVTDPVTWRGQTRLERVKLRHKLGDARHKGGSGSRTLFLGRALKGAAPAWRGTLRILRLDDIIFDTGSARALGELLSLQRLDLHPSVLQRGNGERQDDIVDEANNRLEAWDQNLALARQEGHQIVLIPDRRDTLDGGEFAHLDAATASEMLALLKIFLPRLEKLRVMHVGSRENCVMEDRDCFVDVSGFHSRLAIICPSLRIVHCGPHGIYHGCHAHVAVDCGCFEAGDGRAPGLLEACAKELWGTCGTRAYFV